MNISKIQTDMKRKICDKVSIEQEGVDRFIVFHPFHFADGDHFVVVLKKSREGWSFSDEGHTLMHVQYDNIDIASGTRAALLDGILQSFSVTNLNGELNIPVPNEQFGDALYSFLQALDKISDLNFLSRERARSTFMEDARSLLEASVPEERRMFDYYDTERDPDGNYRVDCKINGLAKPNFVFFINSDCRCQNATIVCHQFEKWNIPFRATGIFENQTEINRLAIAQFSDVAYKQIPSLGSKDRINNYLLDVIRGS